MANRQITILDKTFALFIPEAEILQAVRQVVERLRADYADKVPVFVTVLNGAFVFAADVFRLVDFPCQMVFAKVSSYDGLTSSGKVVEQLPLDAGTLRGRHVIVLEDIVEKGYTMDFLLKRIRACRPASVEVCALSCKPERIMVPGLKVKYVGMNLPEAFIVGYGLDYNQQGRNLRDIYSLVEDKD